MTQIGERQFHPIRQTENKNSINTNASTSASGLSHHTATDNEKTKSSTTYVESGALERIGKL